VSPVPSLSAEKQKYLLITVVPALLIPAYRSKNEKGATSIIATTAYTVNNNIMKEETGTSSSKNNKNTKGRKEG
jgi:hypothetical protein